jgi:hypothetical protein
MFIVALIASGNAAPPPIDVTPLARASATVDGLFTYYFRREPNRTLPAAFFFSCGQIGGSAPEHAPPLPASQCQCESEDEFGCVNCYRWWSAVALEALASYAIAANLTSSDAGGARILAAAESMWRHAPYNAAWNATKHPTWVDDFAWYGLAYARMHDWTGDVAWRQRASALLEWGFTYGWDAAPLSASTAAGTGGATCGGFWWSLHEDERFKDSISIVELLHLAARLATTATSADERGARLAQAEEIWSWLGAFSGGRGLLAANGLMSTGVTPEWCCSAHGAAADRANGTACVNSQVALTLTLSLALTMTLTLTRTLTLALTFTLTPTVRPVSPRRSRVSRTTTACCSPPPPSCTS